MRQAKRQYVDQANQWDDPQCLGDKLSCAARCYVAARSATPPPADWPWPAANWNVRDEQSNWVGAGALYLASAEQAWRLGRPATRACARRRAVALTVRLDLARGRWGGVGSCDR